MTLAAQQGSENAPGDAGSDDDYVRVQDSSIRSAAETPGLRRQAPYCSVCMGGRPGDACSSRGRWAGYSWCFFLACSEEYLMIGMTRASWRTTEGTANLASASLSASMMAQPL